MPTTLESIGSLPIHGPHYHGAGLGAFKLQTRRIDLEMTAAHKPGSHHGYGYGPISKPIAEEPALLDLCLKPGWAQALETLVATAVMEERRRLAREIHDTLAQAFSGILLHLEVATGLQKAKGLPCPAGLSQARELARSGLEDARRMLLNLRPIALESNTLSEALRRLGEQFSRDGQIPCRFQASGCEGDMLLAVQDELYRVAQEALCNVRKHARATCVSVTLDCGLDVVALSIRDNGCGLPTASHQTGGCGYGLRMMRERARHLGGNLKVITAAGSGTQILICVPQSANNPMERKPR